MYTEVCLAASTYSKYSASWQLQ